MSVRTGHSRQEEWDALITRLRREERPGTSQVLAEFYGLVQRDVGPIIQKAFHNLGDAECADVVASKFFSVWTHLIKESSRHPRGLFLTACNRAAIDQLRRIKTAEKCEDKVASALHAESRRAEDTEHSLDLAALFATLSHRDQQILRAVAEGEDREELGRQFGISRAAIDQIVSRARRMKETS